MRTLLGLMSAVDFPFAFEEWFSFLQDTDPAASRRTTMSGLLDGQAGSGEAN
ncbi:hypothetical protein KJ567_06375 [Candidatus Bipolaricaulota bacterium]|nr:hypothetical protein [Candidatus Bipolaricaulota bacterium]